MDTGACFDTVGRAKSRKKAYELKFAEPRPFADPDVAARKAGRDRQRISFLQTTQDAIFQAALCTAWAFWGQSA